MKKKQRTSDEINREYSQECTRLGDLDVKIDLLTIQRLEILKRIAKLTEENSRLEAAKP